MTENMMWVIIVQNFIIRLSIIMLLVHMINICPHMTENMRAGSYYQRVQIVLFREPDGPETKWPPDYPRTHQHQYES